MHSVEKLLESTETLFLDTAPIIYFVEGKEPFVEIARPIFRGLSEGVFVAIVSPITLAECLYYPYKHENPNLVQKFASLLVAGPHTLFVPTTAEIGTRAAQLRAKYNLHLLDAIQLATAVVQQCTAFLTNDKQLRRVQEIEVFVLEELTLP